MRVQRSGKHNNCSSSGTKLNHDDGIKANVIRLLTHFSRELHEDLNACVNRRGGKSPKGVPNEIPNQIYVGRYLSHVPRLNR